MVDDLRLLDARLLLALNDALAGSPRLHAAALFLTDRGTDLALLGTTAWLWFWPERGAAGGPATREESRARLLVFGVAAMAAYVAARLLAMALDQPRPFATYLPVSGPPGVFEGLRTYGTFPSDHAALLGALPLVFARWSAALAGGWAALGTTAVLARVGVGFHYPSDMAAGALLGLAAGAAATAAYERLRPVRGLADALAAGFVRPPYAYGLYFLLALGGAEFAAHFKHLLAALVWLRWNLW